jgi:hypothetical protein
MELGVSRFSCCTLPVMVHQRKRIYKNEVPVLCEIMGRKRSATAPALMRVTHPLEDGLNESIDFENLTFPQQRFLKAFVRYGVISHAACAAGVTRQTVYNWKQSVPGEEMSMFARAFLTADEMRIDRIEAEMHRRAIEGWDEPVFHRGRQVGTIRRFDSRLLEVLAKAAKPLKYRDNIKVDTKISGGVLLIPATTQTLTAEEWAAESNLPGQTADISS